MWESLTGRGKAPRSELLVALRRRFMQDPGFGVPRIYLLGRWVNKGKRKGRAPKEPGPRLTSHYIRLARRTLVTRLLVPSSLKTSSVVNNVHRRFTRFPRVTTSTGGAGPLTGGATFWLMSFLLSSPYAPQEEGVEPLE